MKNFIRENREPGKQIAPTVNCHKLRTVMVAVAVRPSCG